MKRLAELLLRLYPPGFRKRFASEWRETAAWHQERLAGSSFAGVRLAAVLLRDTLASVPGAYRSAVGESLRRVESVRQDFRHAVRGLWRSPVFTAAAVASLGVGIGANTAIFSVVDAVLLEPLPYPGADRLAIVWNEFPAAGLARLPLSPPEVAELADEPVLFESVGGVWATSLTVLDREDAPTQVPAGRVTPNFFAVLGVEPALGSGWVNDGSEGERPRGVIISHELWKASFGGDPGILERSLRVDGVATPVVGVMPEGFKLVFPPDGSVPERLDVYGALPWNLRALPVTPHYLRVVGRLRPGEGLDPAQRAVEAVAERVHSIYPELIDTGDRFSIRGLQDDSVRAARPILLVLLTGVGLFLLLASANVASLVLARASAREREMAVRSALGASRGRIAQLLGIESLLLGVLSAALGLWLGSLGAQLLWTFRPEGIARVDVAALDGSVVLFTVGVSVVATLLFGAAPIGLLHRAGPAAGLRSAGGRSVGSGSLTRRWVTIGEVAIGLVLLVGASLMGQTVSRLGRADIGFDPGRALTFKVSLSERRFPTALERAEIAREIDRRVADLPGVMGVGATSHVPMGQWANWGDAAPPEGVSEQDARAYFADHRAVTPTYFDAVGARLAAGRHFDGRDQAASAPVIIIDETMARRAFPDGDALGKVLHPSRYVEGDFVSTPATVVGIIEDIRDVSPGRPSGGQVYWPFSQSARWELTWVVRTEADIAELLPMIRREVRAVRPDLAVASARSMEELMGDATAGTRFLALLGGVFSAMALCLAALGLYGVITYVTVRRTRELGLRAALGAGRGRILGDVVRDGLSVGALGVALGLAGAVGSTRFMASLLYGISATDLTTLGAAAVFFLLVSVAASLGPAWRATRIDPAVAIRE